MFDTAVASYAYAIFPAFDIVFPVKGNKWYYPTLVSIKCWDSMSTGEMEDALNAMESYVEGYRDKDDSATKALCILLVLGCRNLPQKSPAPSRGSFPTTDAYRTIIVPANDSFHLSSNAMVGNVIGSERAEMLLSHLFAHVEDSRYLAI